MVFTRLFLNLIGEFRKEEIGGGIYLVYHNVKFQSPQVENPKAWEKVAIDFRNDYPPTTRDAPFTCPSLRSFAGAEDQELFKCRTSPYCEDGSGHHVLPLFWCNNKEAGPDSRCCACATETVGTVYYLCVECDSVYHKECVESPIEICYPSHYKVSINFKHSFQLYFSTDKSRTCNLCGHVATHVVYFCAVCDIVMHVLCAKAPIPFLTYREKTHDHYLTLSPRQASLTCNVCATVDKLDLTYVCAECDFVTHTSCMFRPNTTRISRHHHRVSFVSSFRIPRDEHLLCGVCRRMVDLDYGAYACKVCSDYVVHTKCLLRGDIWDGSELEGEPEDEYENVDPFERIDDALICHFSHGHPLRLEVSKVFDVNSFCQACGLLIHEGDFYACEECNFVLHETCANVPRKIVHPLRPHQLEVTTSGTHLCAACTRFCSGFVYGGRNFNLDARCAMISEPFSYQGHQHSLYLSVHPSENRVCCVCKSTEIGWRILNCIECEFSLCIKCATLPYMVKYKHDEHHLTFCGGEEASDSDWCELCEGKLALNGGGKGFYKCEDCCTTLHVDCLLGTDPYLVPGKAIMSDRLQVRRNNSPSRKICFSCQRRCPYPIFLVGAGAFFCSLTCVLEYEKD